MSSKAVKCEETKNLQNAHIGENVYDESSFDPFDGSNARAAFPENSGSSIYRALMTTKLFQAKRSVHFWRRTRGRLSPLVDNACGYFFAGGWLGLISTRLTRLRSS